MEQPVRIGIVGAGTNTRAKHIPGFRAIPQVEIVGVVNRSEQSSVHVATEFGIPKTYPNWQALVDDPGVDAVLIGTWPNMHCEITCAALKRGKHVLTEARMARNLAEAQQMLAASQAHPNLVAQVVPSPFGLEIDPFVRDLIEHGYIGDLREMVVIGADDAVWDYSKPLHWRQDRELSGLNTLSLGILHETAMRWTPATTRVFAQSALFEPQRPAPDRAGNVAVTVPDSLQVLTQLEGGGRGIYHMSGVTLFGPGRQIHLYGSHGTIRVEFGAQERVLCGRAGDNALRVVEVPADKRSGWRVEEEFISAIRGKETVKFTDFATGVRYMEFTEAVARSAESQSAIDLPLQG